MNRRGFLSALVKLAAIPVVAPFARMLPEPMKRITNSYNLNLRKEEWLQLEAIVLKAARYRLRAWADLTATNDYESFSGTVRLHFLEEVKQ